MAKKKTSASAEAKALGKITDAELAGRLDSAWDAFHNGNRTIVRLTLESVRRVTHASYPTAESLIIGRNDADYGESLQLKNVVGPTGEPMLDPYDDKQSRDLETLGDALYQQLHALEGWWAPREWNRKTGDVLYQGVTYELHFGKPVDTAKPIHA